MTLFRTTHEEKLFRIFLKNFFLESDPRITNGTMTSNINPTVLTSSKSSYAQRKEQRDMHLIAEQLSTSLKSIKKNCKCKKSASLLLKMHIH